MFPRKEMKRTPLYLLFLVSAVYISGCSTARTNSPGSHSQWGNEYSGTVCAAGMAYLTLFVPIYLPLFPFMVADTGLSFAADTILLPIELFADNPDLPGYNCGTMM